LRANFAAGRPAFSEDFWGYAGGFNLFFHNPAGVDSKSFFLPSGRRSRPNRVLLTDAVSCLAFVELIYKP
jgi:hypothetical protein